MEEITHENALHYIATYCVPSAVCLQIIDQLCHIPEPDMLRRMIVKLYSKYKRDTPVEYPINEKLLYYVRECLMLASNEDILTYGPSCTSVIYDQCYKSRLSISKVKMCIETLHDCYVNTFDVSPFSLIYD